MHLVTFDDTEQLFDMYHVNNKISEAYYDTNTSRFKVDLSENFENYPIGDFMRYQEVIPSISNMIRSANDMFYDFDSLSEYDQVPLLVAKHQEKNDSPICR